MAEVTSEHLRRTPLVALVLAAGLALAGCSGSSASVPSQVPSTKTNPSSTVRTPSPGPSSSEASSAAPAVTVADLPTFADPIEAYRLDGANLYTMQKAQNQLSNQCMARFGFPPYDLTPSREVAINDAKESNANLYGVVSLPAAKAYGYQDVPVDPDQPGPNSSAQATPTSFAPSSAYMFVYLGSKSEQVAPPPGGWKSPGKFGGITIPPGGCLGQARTQLWGSPDSMVKDQLAQSLGISSYNDAMADSRVQALFAKWSSCMAEQGYQYRNPLQPKFGDHGGKPSRVEIATAVADVGCKTKINLVPQWNKITVQYENQAIEKNQLALTEESNKIKAALKKATEVLNGGH